MIKRIICLSLVVLFGLTTGVCLAKYSGGDGSESTPYRISNAYDMNDIGLHQEDWGSHFVMVNDVNLAQFTGTQFNLIGKYISFDHPDNEPFAGVFDGKGHTISNFTYQNTGRDGIGIFSYLKDTSAVVKDLTLVNPNVSGGDFVGSLVGYLIKGTTSNCGAEGGTVWGNFMVGGLVGANYDGCISNCYSIANVNGNNWTGGLAGANTGGLAGANRSAMSNCYAAGNVVGSVNTGGLVGRAWRCAIVNSYSVSAVDGNEHTGGLVGDIWGDSQMFLSNCYAAGGVSGTTNVGGLVGYDGGGVLTSYTKCFWDSDVNPDVNGIGNTTEPNVIGKSTAEMQTESTFTSAGWDFVGETINGPNDIWTIHDGVDYPKLVWPLINFVGWYEVDLADYAFFSNYWKDTNCSDANDCNGVDLDFSDTVDEKDLKILLDHWLTGLQ